MFHSSRVARREDEARRHWFDEDDAQRLQEDWNLLYGRTRARQVLIVSGRRPAGASTTAGTCACNAR
jgi:hypothetical protein